jgi:3-hydroxyisobutyrate dehydrogenase
VKVAFIGTGKIGNPMAEHIIKAGHDVVVHDLRKAAAGNLLTLGAAWAETAAAAVRDVEVVLTSVPGPQEVEAVLTRPGGIIEGASPGLAHLDLSTNLPSNAPKLAAAAAERGVTFLDSPVSGGVAGAEDGTLAVMAGGDEEVFNRYRPLLEAFGKNIFHMGALGNGYLVKLVNNMVSLSSRQFVQEALVLAEKSGLDPLNAYAVMSVSSSSRYVGGVQRMLEREFENPSFTLGLAAKDTGLALDAAAEVGLDLPVLAAAHNNLQEGIAAGLGELSSEAILLLYEKRAGLER